MPLDTELERWKRRIGHLLTYIDGLLCAGPMDDTRPVLSSAIRTLQEDIAGALGRPDGSDPRDLDLAAAIGPLLKERDAILAVQEFPGGWPQLRDTVGRLRSTAQGVQEELVTNSSLSDQTVVQIVEDLHTEVRLYLILSLTANREIFQQLRRWKDLKGKATKSAGHLDLRTFNFVAEAGSATVPMEELWDASTAAPVVAGPYNFGAAAAEMQAGGGSPPPMYRVAYSQWFTSTLAAWEDVYRKRLAVAHSREDGETTWRASDIKSNFFNAIRLVRNDISHHDGICIDSREVGLFDWLESGQPIAPNPMQMIDILGKFPFDELRQRPAQPSAVSAKQIPYVFDSEWVAGLKKHVERLDKTKEGRARIIRRVLDDWMNEKR